ncbi:hypothetical protein PhCBS80983_g03195 [Powellomyces hirtus]|uniref:AN1-type domain-containing protein n=1 Tax=Powellomyces hirtus TaxID=109895 RepID=A0A507E2R4_9FUNG|nr:hypothetical protein PhCBS80983_g03195 [Powellomyces hirtus]
MKCKDFDKFGFAPVRDVGLARRIKVACSTRSNNECAVNRWKTRARAALMNPHRDANAAGPANLTSAMQGGDALWFHSCPNNLGKRDITSFIGHFIPRSNELQFVQPGRAVRASLPAHIGTSFPGAREYFVRFRSEVDSKVLQALLRGREEFVSALRSTDLLGPEDVIMPTIAIEARPTRTMPVPVEVPPEQPNPVPTNAYELLPAIEDETPSTIPGDVEKKEPGTTEPSEEPSLQNNEDNPPPSSDAVPSTKKKKKKKSGTGAKQEAEVEVVVEKIENITIAPAPSNQCAAPRCTAKCGIMGVVCEFCNRKFCLAHRHPESHSLRCAEQKRDASRAAQKRDATLIIEAGKRDPTIGNRINGAAKEREDAKRRLKERIEGASRASSAAAGAKDKKKRK